MSSVPVMVFAAFASETDPRFVGWDTMRRQLQGKASVASELPHLPPHAGIWRLLAPNNRELARSARLYSGEAAAAEHFLELQSEADRFEVIPAHGPVATALGWLAVLDGRVVMTSARWYEGQASSRSAAAGALAALAEARLSAAALHLPVSAAVSQPGAVADRSLR